MVEKRISWVFSAIGEPHEGSFGYGTKIIIARSSSEHEQKTPNQYSPSDAHLRTENAENSEWGKVLL